MVLQMLILVLASPKETLNIHGCDCLTSFLPITCQLNHIPDMRAVLGRPYD